MWIISKSRLPTGSIFSHQNRKQFIMCLTGRFSCSHTDTREKSSHRSSDDFGAQLLHYSLAISKNSSMWCDWLGYTGSFRDKEVEAQHKMINKQKMHTLLRCYIYWSSGNLIMIAPHQASASRIISSASFLRVLCVHLVSRQRCWTCPTPLDTWPLLVKLYGA